MYRVVAAAAAALTLACGGLLPKEGDSCSAAGGCQDTETALFCENGKLRAIPCKGAGGCVTDSATLTCNVRAVAGDRCAADHETRGQCDSADADAALVCTGGTWAGQPCKACGVQSGNVVCQP